MNRLKKILLPLSAVALGVVVFSMLMATKPKPPREKSSSLRPTVHVVVAKPRRETVHISGRGSVIAAKEVSIVAEVSGRIVWQNERLVPGGYFKKNEALLRLESQRYAWAVQQRQAELQRSELEFKQELGRQEVAHREWNLVKKEAPPTELSEELTLRKPQLRSARASLEAARARLDEAKLNHTRTRIVAPFNAFVRAEAVDRGQFVNAGATLATLVGTDEFWVRVLIPVDRLQWLSISPKSTGKGIPATINYDHRGQRLEKPGEVFRLLADVDPNGRMARLLVRVRDPLELEKTTGNRQPILLGSYVDITITGDALENVFVIPRAALRDDDSVWVVDQENKAQLKKITIAWRREKDVLVRSGLNTGDRIITSLSSDMAAGRVVDPVLKTNGKKTTRIDVQQPPKTSTTKATESSQATQ